MSMPQIEIEQSDEKKVTIELSTHGPIVSITSAMVKMAIAALGQYIAAKAGGDFGSAMTYIGHAITAGMALSLADTLHGSNQATRALIGAQQ